MKPKVFLGEDEVYISYSPRSLGDVELCVQGDDIDLAQNGAKIITECLCFTGSRVNAFQSTIYGHSVEFINTVVFFFWAKDDEIDEYRKMAKAVENWPAECEYNK